MLWHGDLAWLKRVELVHVGKTLLHRKFLNKCGRILFNYRNKDFRVMRYVETISQEETYSFQGPISVNSTGKLCRFDVDSTLI